MDWKTYIFNVKTMLRDTPEYLGVVLPNYTELIEQIGPTDSNIHNKDVIALEYGYFGFTFSATQPYPLLSASFMVTRCHSEGLFFNDWNPSKTTTVDDYLEFCRVNHFEIGYDPKYEGLKDRKAFATRPGTSILFHSYEGDGHFEFCGVTVTFRNHSPPRLSPLIWAEGEGGPDPA